MGTAGGRPSSSLIEQLDAEPARFDFFQAVRILELVAARIDSDAGREPVFLGEDGRDGQPEWWLRLAAQVSLQSPRSSIASLERNTIGVAAPGMSVDFRDDALGPKRNQAMEWADRVMRVAVFGLIGPVGTLPLHYTQETLDRIRINDNALRDFLDIFHHRLLSYFYRAWRKYRFFLHFEVQQFAARNADEQSGNPMRNALFSLVGQGTRGLSGRLRLPDSLLLYYSGHFAARPRPGPLNAMLEEYFGVPTRVQALRGAWLELSPDQQSRLASPMNVDGATFNQLGITAFLGERAWGIEDGVRIWLGPLNWHDFQRFLPAADRGEFTNLAQFARRYVGLEADIRLRLILIAAEVPECCLGDAVFRLGWSCWLLGKPKGQDAMDAEFELTGWPTK